MCQYLKAITQARNTKLCSILPKDRKARFEIWVLRSSEFCISTAPLTDWVTGSPLDPWNFEWESHGGATSALTQWPLSLLFLCPITFYGAYDLKHECEPLILYIQIPYISANSWPLSASWAWGEHLGVMIFLQEDDLGHSWHRLRAFGRIFLV